MPNRAMVSLSDVLAWGPQTEGVDEEVMSRCIDAASELIEQMTGMRFLEADYVAQHSGNKATGGWAETLWLADPVLGLATPNVTEVTLLTENDVVLETILIPSAVSIAAMDGALIDTHRGTAVRGEWSGGGLCHKSWTAGNSNITISYTAGWAQDAMPDDIKHAAIELSKFIYRDGFRVGVSSMAGGGASASYRLQLSAASNQALDFWTRYYPRTLGP